nr:hypothetical protein [Nocardia acidivorans]
MSDRYRIITTLLDHRTDPAIGIIGLYHERWEVESAYFALRHTMFHGRVLRSADPVGLEQEVWAMLTVYQRLRRAMCDAVETVRGTDPDRASFTAALTAAIDQIVTAANVISNIVPGNSIATAVLSNLLPARRLRLSVRKVKCPMSRYGNPPTDTRPTSSQTVTRLKISLLAGEPHPPAAEQPGAGPDRRNQVLRLLRADPDRAWTPQRNRPGAERCSIPQPLRPDLPLDRPGTPRPDRSRTLPIEPPMARTRASPTGQRPDGRPHRLTTWPCSNNPMIDSARALS